MNLSRYKSLSQNEYSAVYELLYKRGEIEFAEKQYHKKRNSLKSDRTFLCWGASLLAVSICIYLSAINEEINTFIVTAWFWYFIGWSVKKNEWNSEKNEILFELATDEYESSKEIDENNKPSSKSTNKPFTAPWWARFGTCLPYVAE